ncbi:MAG: alcohol dehydrogenase catalytic domain-containing protein [Acidobacteria bacterium]|nr:alcohol dehydrogenase catalytic domain-containing protein [Acidobacteriota bacterium]
MKALYFDGQLGLRDVETPRPGPDEALIQVVLAGICGTDLQILNGYSSFRGIPGHEFVGRVVECQNTKWIDKRVVGEINISCGECEFCLWGLGRHCSQRTVMGIVNRDGAFAEFTVLPVFNLHEIPDSIPDEAAVFVEPLAAAAEILEQVTIRPRMRVAVLGDGRLGLLVAQVLHQERAQVMLLGRHPWKLDLAHSWGINVSGLGDEHLTKRNFPMVVEATGSPAGLEEAFRLVEPRGTIIMKSTFHRPAQFDTARLVVDEINLLGSRCGAFGRAIGLLEQGRVKVDQLVSRTFPLEEGLAAFDFVKKTSPLKVLLQVAPA